MSNEVNLASVLAFFTGTNRVPPLGFHQEPRLYFVHDDIASLAIASTCDLSLALPIVHKEYGDFREKMIMCLTCNDGLGRP